MIELRRISAFLIISIFISASILTIPLSAYAVESSADLMVIEWYGKGRVTLNVILNGDDSSTNPDYELIGVHWYTTANYYINPRDKYGFTDSEVVNAIIISANTWDEETSALVFSYKGTTTRSAGRRDGYNVVAWGTYRRGAIAVTYIWYSGSTILETDVRMNTYYRWSLSGESGKMDVQNIMTHEFGHWVGLDDLYSNSDYWLTMYGYSKNGETYKQTLGWGDIDGLEAWYGP